MNEPTPTPEDNELGKLTPSEPTDTPAPEDVTTFDEDENPEANVGDEAAPTPEETDADNEVEPSE